MRSLRNETKQLWRSPRLCSTHVKLPDIANQSCFRHFFGKNLARVFVPYFLEAYREDLKECISVAQIKYERL